MSRTNTHMLGVSTIAASYEKIAADVTLILRRRYKLTVKQADEAVLLSPLKSIFHTDPEMAAHTSNETWAREVLAYWKQSADN